MLQFLGRYTSFVNGYLMAEKEIKADARGVGVGQNVEGSTIIPGDRNAAGNILNFHASTDPLGQIYMAIMDVKINVGNIDAKFEIQGQKIQNIQLDILSLKQEALMTKQRLDNQQQQGDRRGEEISSLKNQVDRMANASVKLNRTIRVRYHVEMWIIGIGAMLFIWLQFNQQIFKGWLW
jgi:hypothetical protein